MRGFPGRLDIHPSLSASHATYCAVLCAVCCMMHLGAEEGLDVFSSDYFASYFSHPGLSAWLTLLGRKGGRQADTTDRRR